ncbi:MAG: zinc ribbon domain-containing protein [Dehalococcoidia bacterium]
MVDELFEVFEDLFERRSGSKGKKGKKGVGKDERAAVESPVRPTLPPLFCLECGTKNGADGKFCQECGSLLPSAGQDMRCLRCDSAVPLTAKFCARCGAPVDTASGLPRS